MCNDFLPMYSQQNCTAASHHLWKVAWILLTEQRECFPLRGPHPHTRSGILSCSWDLFFVLILFLNLCGKGLPKNLHLCLRKATESTGEFRKKFHWKQLPILWNNSMFFFPNGRCWTWKPYLPSLIPYKPPKDSGLSSKRKCWVWY